MILALCSSLLSCSSPQSQQRLDTVLCWLRPSCLPSEVPSPTEEAPQTDTPSEPINSVVSSEGSEPISPQIYSSGIRNDLNCLTSAQITVTSSNPFVSISYIEPTTKANGQALTNLAKTTIYQDIGKGLLKYKEIRATNPRGGGTIREKVPFSLKPEETLQATICITATDTNGQEG
jgi:hypothetical protein